MISVRCYFPAEPRMSDDICHSYCLSLGSMETQSKMFALQEKLYARLGDLLIELSRNTEALRAQRRRHWLLRRLTS